MQRHRWTQDEDTALVAEYPTTTAAALASKLGVSVISVYGRAWRLGLTKTSAFKAELLRIQTDRLRQAGAKSRFVKGGTSWNAGQKGRCAPGSEQSRFKPGHRPHSWRPIGSERRHSDGHWYRKITDVGPNRFHCRPVYLLVWESHFGPVPRGHAVIFKDRNPDHIAIGNLMLVTRKELMRLNSIHRYPEDLKQVMYLKGRVTRVINERDRADEK